MNSGAATGNSRHSATQATTANTIFSPEEIARAFSIGIDGSADFRRHHQLDQVRITAIGQAEVEVANDGDRHKDLWCQHQRREQHHGAVSAADCRRGGCLVNRQPQDDAQRKRDEGAQFRAHCDEHAAKRPLHDVSHVEQRADAEEHQDGDEAVRKSEGVESAAKS